MKQHTNFGSLRQQGIALPIIMIILVLAALVTIYTTTTSVKEQQVTADQYRSEQAFSAAQAGVEHAVMTHNGYSPQYDAGGNLLPSGADLNSDASFSKGSYTVMYCDIWDEDDDAPNVDTDGDLKTGASMLAQFLNETNKCLYPIDPANTNNTTDVDGFHNDKRVGVLSVGKPDDASGRRTVSVVSAPGDLLSGGGPPAVPLTAKGPTGIGGGNISIVNRYENITVWVGADVDTTSSAMITLLNDGTLDPADANNRGELIKKLQSTPSCNSYNTYPNTKVASCKNIGNNADILDGDSNLKEIGDDEMFARIFSASKGEIRELAKEIGKFYTNASDFQGETGLIWLEASDGDSPAVNVGTLDAPTYNNDAPAFLVIDVVGGGTVKINTGEAFGMVFIFGNVDFVGSPVFVGSIIITGDIGSHGTPWIIYDDVGLSMNPEGLGGMRGIEPGTWKDWGYVN